MIITIFNLKGGQGKTSLSLALALEYGFYVATNEEYSPIDEVLPKGRAQHIKAGAALPTPPKGVNVIYDFGGSPDERVLKAAKISDWVIVPIKNEKPIGDDKENKRNLELTQTIATLQELKDFKDKIILVINNTEKKLVEQTKEAICKKYPCPTFVIKPSAAFKRVLTDAKPISELRRGFSLFNLSFEEPFKQLQNLYDFMEKN